MKLTKVIIHKYKSFETAQEFEVDPLATVLVGLNESGKTSILEAIAKTNYFEKDSTFDFNITHDYPRKEKKSLDKSKKDPEAVSCIYQFSEALRVQLSKEFSSDFNNQTLTVITKFSGQKTIDFEFEGELFLRIFHEPLCQKLKNVKTVSEVDKIISESTDSVINEKLKEIRKYFENTSNWNDPIKEYIYRVILGPKIPKYLYYDEYYSLPSRISIEQLENSKLGVEELKTAKALFELSDINIKELLKANNFENFKAELEATSANITDELFKFWSTNKNLEIQFDIDKIESSSQPPPNRIIEHILDIRVRNNRAKVSLPLKNRSKGFNWFFSFLVWFRKIQVDKGINYIILLDEPGLNLHAKAQSDLLRFIESLTENYQVIYTTHSPFMVSAEKLHRVRTVLETPTGSVISDSVQEKDPNTLFPLQAALGYDIAQNLYISKKNLLVEGISDLVYLGVISSFLEKLQRGFLDKDITIVPVGGLEKVATFISLLRGNELNIVCLLDSTIGQSETAKLDKLILNKIINKQKILKFQNFRENYLEADIEDLFEEADYLKIYNGAFPEAKQITTNDLSSFPENTRIIGKINQHLKNSRFNHYLPANFLAKNGLPSGYLNEQSLGRFEKLFIKVNAEIKKNFN